jgi:hypothetical protein
MITWRVRLVKLVDGRAHFGWPVGEGQDTATVSIPEDDWRTIGSPVEFEFTPIAKVTR